MKSRVPKAMFRYIGTVSVAQVPREGFPFQHQNQPLIIYPNVPHGSM
jgi:hypothetical protein